MEMLNKGKMAKLKKQREGIDQGFKAGDKVRHIKNGFEGIIHRLDWAGSDRAALVPTGKADRGWHVYILDDIELVQEAIKETMKLEPENGETDGK